MEINLIDFIEENSPHKDIWGPIFKCNKPDNWLKCKNKLCLEIPGPEMVDALLVFTFH